MTASADPARRKLPIIYSRHYDIRFFGLEKRHPFDTCKYGKVYRYLRSRLGIPKRRFYHPRPVSRRDLLTVHNLDYLTVLRQPAAIAQIAELPALGALPGWLLRRLILRPMAYATGGTLLGATLALQYGWSINLAGGYHHARGAGGGGFCFYADIPLAVYSLLKRKPDLSVLIVDLDVHQGNGCADIFKHDADIHLLDVYNPAIYPCDNVTPQYVDFNCPVMPSIRERDYLTLVADRLLSAIHDCRPELLIYNAGTDILEGDPLGGMHISEAGVIARDALVFRQALAHRIPILMLLAGGYTRSSAAVIAHSIEHLLRTVLAVER